MGAHSLALQQGTAHEPAQAVRRRASNRLDGNSARARRAHRASRRSQEPSVWSPSKRNSSWTTAASLRVNDLRDDGDDDVVLTAPWVA
ncbi:hypothetical protein MTO96_008425 [Rhipicephalus appendiculatus]